MELTIRAEGTEAAESLRTALDRAGDFQLSEVEDNAFGVVAGSGDGAALAAALQAWLRAQPPGSELTVETGTQVLTVHAGDPRASIALTEAVTRAGRSEPPAGFPRLKEPRPGSPPPDGYDV